jgi:hypothetical protein
MSFFDTLKNLGLFQPQGGQGQPQQPQQNPYGLDPAMMRQAQMQSLGNIGGQIMALSQQMTPAQRASMMSRADWTGGMQNNLYNAAQMKLMGDAGRRKEQESERMQAAQMQLGEALKGMPDSQEKRAALFFIQAGDLNKAAELVYGGGGNEPPTMKTIRVGDKDVTYQWTGQGWQKFGEGEAFKPTPDTVVNNSVNTGGSEDFDKNLMKGVGAIYTTAAEAGGPAVEAKTAIGQLRELLQNNGGALDGFTSIAASYLPAELLPEGANDIVAAQAIIAGLIPKQRIPGSGATSDFDAKQFAASLPSIWNKPGANEIILDTIEALSDHRIAVSNIILDVAADPSITNKSGAIREAISSLPDPMENWRRMRNQLNGGSTGQTTTGGKQSLPEEIDLDSALREYQ